MDRITYKRVKQWLGESEFAKKYGITIGCWDGYYHLMSFEHERICTAKTPGELWEKFQLYRSGYYLGVKEV